MEQFLSDNYFLQGFEWSIINSPKSKILISEEEIDGEYYREEIYYNDIAAVNEINENLSKIDLLKLKEYFFKWDLSNHKIYKTSNVNSDSNFKELQEYLNIIIEFYKKAVVENNFVIVIIE